MSAPAYRETVLAAFRARLASIAGVAVFRNRSKPVKDWPALVMFDGGHAEPVETTGETTYRLEIDVEGHVKAASDEGLGPAASELYAQLLDAITADRTLGGAVQDITEGDMDALDLPTAEGSAGLASFTIAFTVIYATAAGNPRAGA